MKKLALLFVLAFAGCDIMEDTLTQPFQDGDPCYTVRIYTFDGELLSETFESERPTGDTPPGTVRVVIPGCE